MTTKQAKLDVGSQRNVLRRRVEQAGIGHGQKALVTVQNIRREPGGVLARSAQAFFCNVPNVVVHHVVGTKDGQELPKEVKLVAKLPEGHSDLLAILELNGTMKLTQVADMDEGKRQLQLA